MRSVPAFRWCPAWAAASTLLALAAALGCGSGGGMGQGGRGGQGGGGGAPGPPPDGIVVDTPSGMPASESADGYCDILEAVAAADTRQSVHECANPKGSQTIVLKGGATYPTGKTLRFKTPPPPADPTPARFTIAEGTSGMATISAAPPWLLDPGDPPTACLVHISKGATVAAARVMLTQAGDASLALTGACVTNGALTLREGRVTGFRESGLHATCVPSAGCDYARDNTDGARIEVASSLVDHNASSTDGGGLYSVGFNATVVVNHSSFIENTAARGGGGLYFGGGWNTNVIRASTVSGNRALVGGGVMVKFECSNTYLNVFASTIADNTAQQTGGGIQFEPADLACAKQDVSVYASLVGGNHAASTSESNINSSWWTPDGFGIFGCYQGSFIYVAPGLPAPEDVDGSCALTSRDPRIGPLTPMGGVGDLPVHPLYPGSPAIDAVTSPAAMYEDQRDGWIPDLDLPVKDEWTLFDRAADGNGDGRTAPDFGAVEMNPRWQTELLSVADKGASAHQVVVTPAGFDRGAGTTYGATGATHEFVTYRLPIAEPGYYDLTVGLLRTPSAGKLQLAVADGSSGGAWTDLGTPQDAFATSPTFAALGPFRSPLFLTAGEKLIRFTVAGKNPASGGYGLTLDYIDAARSRRACPVIQLAAGGRHTCAVTDSGVRCWGDNEAGQLGDGTTAAVWRVPAADTVSDVRAVAAGARHTCVLTTAGGVRCWGANDEGQLGDGTTTERHAPPPADVLGDVKAITAGARHTCALTMAGGVRCWGANTFGQLGDGTTVDRPAPPMNDAAGDAASVSAGSAHTCVVTTAGGVRCWGHNAGGELGNGSLIDAPSPPAADVLASASAVTAAANFTCALMASGGVRCWGYNSDGQIGDETPNATERQSPSTTDVLAGAAAVGAGDAHVCALMKSGGVRCWGANTSGQLADGLAPDPAATPPELDLLGFTGTCL